MPATRIALGRLRTHGLGHRLAHRPQHRLAGTGHAGQHRHDHAGEHGHQVHRMMQGGEAEIVLVGHGQPVPHAAAGQHAQQCPGHTDRCRHQGIVQYHGGCAVAEGLQDGDLAALQAHQPGEHHVQQKGGHRQKDGGQQAHVDLYLGQFVPQPAGGDLLVPADGPQSAPAVQHMVDGGQRVRLVPRCCPLPRQGGRQGIERPFHVHGSGQGTARHPQHGKMGMIGKHAARCQLVEKLRRAAHPHHPKALGAAIDGDLQPGAGLQVMHGGKGLADHHLIT